MPAYIAGANKAGDQVLRHRLDGSRADVRGPTPPSPIRPSFEALRAILGPPGASVWAVSALQGAGPGRTAAGPAPHGLHAGIAVPGRESDAIYAIRDQTDMASRRG